jgi:GNAT superfamily N-acetyltransferase
MSTSELVIETNPTPEQIQYLEDRLYEFNAKATGITDGQGLAIFVRDEQDRIVAGICGHTWGGCCEIRQLWVEESQRRRGLGTRLLRAAEQEARRRHCRQMVLTTFSFQAPEFYTKRGFHLLVAVDDYPHGHQNLLLQKELVSGGGAS